MIKFIHVTDNGQIVGSGVTQDGLESYIQPVEGATLVFGVHTEAGSLNYYDGQKIVPMPPKPVGDYKFNYYTKEWEQDLALIEAKAISKRDQLLVESDYTQLPDVPVVNKEAWAVYRQELRDLPQTTGWPTDIQWPTKPN
jgi:Phage tail assembly chaperone protein